MINQLYPCISGQGKKTYKIGNFLKIWIKKISVYNIHYNFTNGRHAKKLTKDYE